jgi:hypothetical protein
MSDDKDLQRKSTFTYIVGAKQKFWEEVRNPRTKAPITANSVIALLWNRDTDTHVVIVEPVRISLGLVEVTLPYTYMTAPGNFEIEWDITYTDGSDTPTMTIYTTVTAKVLDATYLIGLVSKMRVWVDDDPENESKRIKTDIKYKPYLETAVRFKMSSYSLEEDADGNWDIPTASQPAAESTDEKLITLWGAWYFYKLGYTAIASERTRMFSITYSEAYAQMRDRIDSIIDAITELDPTQAMYFASETSIEYWGQVGERTTEAIATWNT